MKKVIVVHPEKCYGCLTCVVECAYEKGDFPYETPLSPETLGEARLDIVSVGRVAVPLVCNHCEDAPCMAVCPSGAIHRDDPDSPVLLDREKCIGCRACILACPFGMAWMAASGKTAQKCNFCIERTSEGRLPVCVASCPVHALEVKLVDEVVDAAMKQHAQKLVDQQV